MTTSNTNTQEKPFVKPPIPKFKNVPQLGTEVTLSSDDITLSTDGRNYLCRIAYDVTNDNWVTASRFNKNSNNWESVLSTGHLGIIVFLDEAPPNREFFVIRIYEIQAHGCGAYAEISEKSWDN